MENSIYIVAGNILDSVFSGIPAVRNRDAKILAKIIELHEYYYSSRSVNFTFPETRYAYIWKYFCCFAYVFAKSIEELKELKEIFNKDEVSITSVGAGPGTEIVGIIKYCETQNRKGNFTLNCKLRDSNKTWKTT